MKSLAVVLAVLGGVAVATQPLLNGALGRSRGVLEAVFVSISVSYLAIVLALALKAARGAPLGLPMTAWPWLVLWLATVLAALTLALVARTVAIWYFAAGLLGLVVLFAGTVATPLLGAGATVALLTAGQVGAGIAWDQFGVLGLPVIPLTPQRLVGLALVVLGILLIRQL